VFGHYNKKSKFLARSNRCQIKLLNSKLTFRPESFVFPFFGQKKIKFKINRTIISRVNVHAGEICSLTLRLERKLRVSENRVLTNLFGPKRNKVTGE
jgi:hypothetical protein